MENLILLGERRRRLDVQSDDSTITDLCQVFTEDVDSGEVCTVVLTEKGIVAKINDAEVTLWTCNLEVSSNTSDGWFKMDYIDDTLVCLSKRGAIVTVSPSTGEAELVGVFDQGLEDAVWSPDGEVLLMVTSTTEGDDQDTSQVNARLMTMNSQFEVLVEVDIPQYVPSSESSDSDISLAWRPDGTLCGVSCVDTEDGVRKIRIYQRETLELHAIGRAEDASGTLVQNLQSARIAWASTGCSHLLAGVQRKGKKTHQVVFFEPNGLRHREFLLREAPSTNVLSLSWNLSSDLLAVCLREQEGADKVQLWHRMNYHWYLKRELRYPEHRVERLKFNKENSCEVHVLLQGLEWREYEFRWDVSTIVLWDERCNSVVVDGYALNVTEFHKALIPPPMFAKSYSVANPISDISPCYDAQYGGSLLISLSTGDLLFLSIDSIGGTYTPANIMWADLKGIDPTSLRSLIVIRTEKDRLHFVSIECAPCNEGNERLVEATIEDLGTSAPMAFVKKCYNLEGQIFRMTQWLDAVGGCLVQLRDRSLLEYEYTDSGGVLLASDAEPLTEACPWIVAIKEGSLCHDSSHLDSRMTKLVFGLSSKSRLYFHDIMLTDSASSFMISLTHEFLCFITEGSRCQARFLPLKDIRDFDPLMGMDQNLVLEGYEPRNVEQGAKVVAILQEKPLLILQMPRGNLEGIYPRALILRYVMTRIVQGAYGEAFTMMRKHKVDLNFIVDFNPSEFLENGISSFVKQVDNVDFLNLFISNLQNYDVTRTKYLVPTWFDRGMIQAINFDFSTKVNQVCFKAREVMMATETDKKKPNRYFLLPILTTFAKEEPPKLDEALRLIRDDATRHHLPNESKNPLFAENAQNSIQYLAFLAEYELLFETALGMYDFEIARAVARNSQMDPKVYLPLLKRFNTLPMFFSRAEVDIRLKRFDLALRNLHQSLLEGETLDGCVEVKYANLVGNSFNDCLSLINEHQLHKIGLELFGDDSDKKRLILNSLGDNLMDQGRPKVARAVYLSVVPSNFEGAKRAARASQDWRLYFSLHDEVTGGLSEHDVGFLSEKRKQAAREIANEITSSTAVPTESARKSHSDAARILLDYGGDLTGAIDHLLVAEFWNEGYRIATSHSRPDLKKKCVDAAVAFAHTLIGSFGDRISEFQEANERYDEVLKLRKLNVHLEGPHPAEDQEETESLFSAASTTSKMSLRSNASFSSTGSGLSSTISIKSTTSFQMTGLEQNGRHRSKFNKGKKQKLRKKNRKPRQKPGSEEELRELVGILSSTCPSVSYAATVSETILFLIFVQHFALAEEVYHNYKHMCDAIEKFRLERITSHSLKKKEADSLTRTRGENHDLSFMLIELPVEKEVDGMICAPLDTNLMDFFGLIPEES